MEQLQRSWLRNITQGAKLLFWVVLIFLLVQKSCAPAALEAERNQVIDRFQQQRKSRVIAMIHGEDTVSLFGVPVSSYITIEDSEAILRAIRQTPDEQPIDLILHTPGGLLLASEQIAMALVQRKGKVTVYVPHYAMSGGTLLALAADEIVMDPNAVLGPVDPQIGDMPAASIVHLTQEKRVSQISDDMLILADVAQKARMQTFVFVAEVLLKHLPKQRAAALAAALSEGRWTHDFPITVEGAKQLGLPISTNMPQAVYELMDLYPQSGAGRPSVLYVPFHNRPPSANDSGHGSGDEKPKAK